VTVVLPPSRISLFLFLYLLIMYIELYMTLKMSKQTAIFFTKKNKAKYLSIQHQVVNPRDVALHWA
jgi:hypothetical protein